MKNKPLTEKVGNLFPFVFPTFGAQAITNEDGKTMAPNKRLQIARLLSYAKKRI